MTQEDKELLLEDLSARLPYKTIVQIDGCGIWDLRGIDHDDSAELRDRVIVWYGKNQPSSKISFPIINCKPYLLSLSSMTEEQKKYISNKWGINEEFYFEIDPNWGEYFVELGDTVEFIDWLNKNHFDYRGLIPMGLAIDATGLNIY